MPSNHSILCHPFILLPSTFPSIRVFPVSQFIASGDQSIGISASALVLPVNSQDWFPLGLTGLISLQGTCKSLLQHHSSKASVLQHSAFFIVQLLHTSMTTGKTIVLTRRTFVGKVTSLLFNMLSMFVIDFLSRSKTVFKSTWTLNFQMFKLDLEKVEESEINMITSAGSSKKQ